MANIMSMVKLQNKPSRNGFDLSRKVAFSAKVAELLPVETIECIPGDKFKIRKQHFTRTMPVNTAAYTRIREYYDWYFVPTNLLWNKFNTFVSQMTDNNMKAQSIDESSTTGTRQPYFTTKQVYDYLSAYSSNGAHAAQSNNFFGYSRPYLTSKLMDYLGYGSFYGVGVQNTVPSPYPPYQYLSQDRNAVALNPFPLLAYQKIYQDYYRNSQWEKAYAPACNIDYMNDKNNLQLPIDQIDYSAENMFDLRYSNWNKDYFMGVLPNSQYGDAASIDLSGSGSINFGSTSDATNLYLFNSAPTSQVSVTTLPATSVTSTPPAGYDSVIGVTDPTAGRTNSFALISGSVERLRSAMGLSSSGSIISAFTILQLRQAEAAQKWREITQSAQQDYKSQMEAHWGVSVSDAYSDRCKYIDGHVSTIDINEVVNQNLGGSEVADIKGKGVGTGDGFFEFETKVHGYLMCIYHAVPLLDYQITGYKKHNLKVNVTDYAIPEYDRTGMIKIGSKELFQEEGYQDSFQLGYAPQYYEYKTNYDEVKGAFAYGGLNNWVTPFNREYIRDYFDAVNAAFGVKKLEYHFFKVNPSVMNPIFIAQLESGDDKSAELSTDQLLINCSFDIKAVRNLDRNGLPY